MDGYTLLGLKLAMGIIGLVLQINLMGKGNLIKNHNKLVKSLIDGKPIQVISNGKVKTAECMKNSITANDLMFKLRAAGIYEIKTVKRAVFEQNGQLSIIRYGDDDLRYPLIIDGQLDDDVLEIIDRDEEWVKAELEKQNMTIEQVYIGEYLNGQLVAHVYENK